MPTPSRDPAPNSVRLAQGLRRPRLFLGLGIGVALLAVVGTSACGTVVERRDPSGERFPSVRGESLSGEVMQLPEDLAGAPAVLLVGYKQNAQFDLDRWILGLDQAGVKARAIEVPTIDGMVPGLFAGMINDGMRSGIPKEDWPAVVCVYDEAEKIVNFTGDEGGNNGRILLLDAEGVVAYFHDRGYSVGSLNQLRAALEALPTE